MIDTLKNQSVTQRAWVKPIVRACLAIFIGIYSQMILAIPIWSALGSPEQLSFAAELGIKIGLILVECSVLIFIVLDKEPLNKYINLRSPGRIMILGLLASIPLLVANRIMHGWIIRLYHGEFTYYRQLSGSNLGGALFLLLQIAYYFFEVFVLVYAYAKLSEGLRLWRPLPRWSVVGIGGAFLFVTWSLAHGFVVTDLLSFGISLYLPLIFATLYEFTESQIAPMIAWFLFLFV